MPENPSIKYRAFLSYSHADTREAQKVHRSIETFVIDAELVNRETAMGPIPQTLRPVFRDRHDFETGSIFQDQTLVALDASAALIVLCSPSSAQSRAVNEEVRLFRWRHPDRPLIPVMLKGTAETKGREFFPPALRFEIDADGTISDRPQVVLAADIREIGDGYDLAIAKVIARLLGVAPDDIYRRAERQRRQRQHRLIAGLSSVAVMLAGLGIWAEINRREAVAQRKVAELNLKVAEDSQKSIVKDIFDELSQQRGIRTATLGKILNAARQSIDQLLERGAGQKRLQRLKIDLYNKMVEIYEARGDTATADTIARQMVSIARELSNKQPDSPESQHDLALALRAHGGVFEQRQQLVAAMDLYTAAHAIMDKFLERFPKDMVWRVSAAKAVGWLGDICRLQGKVADAARHYRTSQEILAPALQSKDADALKANGIVIANLGDLELQLGNYDKALAQYQESLAIRQRFAEADNGNPNLIRDVATAYQKIGNLLTEKGEYTAALENYQKGLDLAQANVASDVENTVWQHDVTASNQLIGDVLFYKGDLTGARQHYEQNRKLARRLAQLDPQSSEWKQDVWSAEMRIADLYSAEGNYDRAIGIHRAVLTERMAAAPDAPSPRQKLGEYASHVAIGDAYMKKREFEKALASFTTALELAEAVVMIDRTNASAAGDVAAVYGKLGQALANLGRFTEARDMFVKGRDLLAPLVAASPDVILWKSNLDGFEKAIAAIGAAMP